MSLVNEKNSQFIQTRINNRKGVVCNGQSGAGYGSTSGSLAKSVTSGFGKGHPIPLVHYNSCNKQNGGGGHNYDADTEGFSYGYTKEGAGFTSELKGSYAPISINKKTNMCGGKKYRKRRTKKRKRKRRKNKTRKSRRKRRTKRRRKYKRQTKRGGRKKRRKTLSRRQRGGKYAQFGSNIPITPSYSTPNPSGLPWATGPGSFARQINCRDNYNHFKK